MCYVPVSSLQNECGHKRVLIKMKMKRIMDSKCPHTEITILALCLEIMLSWKVT